MDAPRLFAVNDSLIDHAPMADNGNQQSAKSIISDYQIIFRYFFLLPHLRFHSPSPRFVFRFGGTEIQACSMSFQWYFVPIQLDVVRQHADILYQNNNDKSWIGSIVKIVCVWPYRNRHHLTQSINDPFWSGERDSSYTRILLFWSANLSICFHGFLGLPYVPQSAPKYEKMETINYVQDKLFREVTVFILLDDNATNQ